MIPYACWLGAGTLKACLRKKGVTSGPSKAHHLGRSTFPLPLFFQPFMKAVPESLSLASFVLSLSRHSPGHLSPPLKPSLSLNMTHSSAQQKREETPGMLGEVPQLPPPLTPDPLAEILSH